MNSFQLPDFEINPISERDGWRLCDFVCANADHIKRYFPHTVAANLNPTLSNIFVLEKIAEFLAGKEYLFTLKEPKNRKIIGLIFLKELKKETQEAEIAYCIAYTHQTQRNSECFLIKSLRRLSSKNSCWSSLIY
jgi:ribosomal-protein-alanine N-acetyltransferase